MVTRSPSVVNSRCAFAIALVSPGLADLHLFETQAEAVAFQADQAAVTVRKRHFHSFPAEWDWLDIERNFGRAYGSVTIHDEFTRSGGGPESWPDWTDDEVWQSNADVDGPSDEDRREWSVMTRQDPTAADVALMELEDAAAIEWLDRQMAKRFGDHENAEAAECGSQVGHF